MVEFDKETVIPLGRRILEIMSERGDAFTIRAFAQRLGMNRESLRRSLAGERNLAPSELELITKGLGISLERLKRIDTYQIEKELLNLTKGKKLTKIMLTRAHQLATEWVSIACGASERGVSLNLLGRVQYLQRNYEEARQTWRKALEHAKHIQAEYNDSKLLYLVTANLMLTYTMLKEYSNIEETLALVERVFPDNPNVLGMAYFTRARVQEERGDLQLAKKYAYRSLEHFEQTNNDRQIGHATVTVAHYEYVTSNYEATARALASAIKRVQNFEDILVRAVKDYVKALIQLKNYQTATKVIHEYQNVMRDYPEYWGKLQIMKTIVEDDPTYAEGVSNDSTMEVSIRNYACKSLFEYYFLKDDAESAMRYYKMVRIYSGRKSEILTEEGF